MSYRTIIIAITAMCVTSGAVLSQNDSVRSARPSTAAEKLQRYHVALTKEALIEALQNSNAEVRYLAAEQLAANRWKDAVPQIMQATAAETVPLARVNMAFALAQLGVETGFSVLKEACGDNKLKAHVRVIAARYMLDSGNEQCLQDVLAMARSENNADRLAALPLLPRFKKVSRDDADRILQLTTSALRDDRPAVRLTASNTLRMLRDSRAVSYLQAAIAQEQNDEIRSQMERDLLALRTGR